MTAFGAISCGHPTVAGAGEAVLRDGGNAFDAVIAAFFASAVAEPVLASPGGGGYLMARDTAGNTRLYDFFVQTPLTWRPTTERDFQESYADFGTARQVFHIGMGSMGTPGALAGIFAAHEDLASKPMTELIQPAIEATRAGVELRPVDAFLLTVVGPIITARPACRALFTDGQGELLRAGSLLRQEDLADSFEALAREGARLFYEGEMGEALIADCRTQGGLLERQDLRNYRVFRRAPLVQRYRDMEILTNPPPSSGGILMAFALDLLGRDEPVPFKTPAQLVRLARVMDATNRARVETALAEALKAPPACPRNLEILAPDLIARYAEEVFGSSPALRGTTHISVADRQGNVAALSLSNGEGNGYIIPGTGIIMNNMMGEADILPEGFDSWTPDRRLSSMMSPTIAHFDDGRLAALGSGGSNRIRTAILQVLLNLADHGMDMEAAVNAPRLHIEGQIANLEDGYPEPAVAKLAEVFPETLAWPTNNLFFGGVHGVSRDCSGTLQAAGDPRRGGVARLV